MKRKVNPAKSAKVKNARGWSLEEITEGGVLLDMRENPNYPDQYLEIYYFQGDVWVVVVAEGNPERLITAYRSRKLRKVYLP